MDWHLGVIFINNRFLGVEWHPWKIVGWAGNLIFFSRFVVQWWATEKRKQVVVPNAFWWLSLIGSLVLLLYALKRRDSVFIFAYAFTWIPYIRNLVISHRVKRNQVECARCGITCYPRATFCHGCGERLATNAPTAAA